MAGLRTNEFREFSAFRIIIENWLNKSKKEIIKKFDLDPDDNEKDEEKLIQKLEEKIPCYILLNNQDMKDCLL